MVEVGGGIRTYRAPGRDGRPRDVIDGYGEDEMASGGRGQLLAPWPNRLAGGHFEWEGTRLQTAITEVETGSAIHGLVRWSNWTLPEAETLRSPYTPATPVDSTSLGYRLHPQPGWPWTLDLRVTYRLIAGHGLEVRTSVTNRADRPCPLGIGWHPYLKAFGQLVDDCRLTLPAATAYRADERGIPIASHPVAGTDLDFTTARRIGSAHLDVAFTDLHRHEDGRARIRLAGPGDDEICLWLDGGYTHLMVYTGDTLTQPGRRRRGLAVEPMTGAPDLLNNGDGRRVLAPEATFDAVWGINPFSSVDNRR